MKLSETVTTDCPNCEEGRVISLSHWSGSLSLSATCPDLPYHKTLCDRKLAATSMAPGRRGDDSRRSYPKIGPALPIRSNFILSASRVTCISRLLFSTRAKFYFLFTETDRWGCISFDQRWNKLLYRKCIPSASRDFRNCLMENSIVLGCKFMASKTI